MVKIHPITALILYQRVFNQFSAVVGDDGVERMINGSLDDNGISRFCKSVNGNDQSGDDTGNKSDGIGGDVPLMPMCLPMRNGSLRSYVHHRVSQNTVVQNVA